MKEKLKLKILKLYPEFNIIYGPYTRKSDYRKIVILTDGYNKTTRQLAKVKLEVKLNRRLAEGEEVDHRDGDCTNDKTSNLQVLTSVENRKKDVLRRKPTLARCIECNSRFELSVNQEKFRTMKKAGPFCSKSCSGKYGKRIQQGGEIIKRRNLTTKYYRRNKDSIK